MYCNDGKDYKYSLELDRDSSFILKEIVFEGAGSCIGKWHHVTKDTIILNCEAADLIMQLSSGYISKRMQKNVVLDKNKLNIDQLILTRSTKTN